VSFITITDADTGNRTTVNVDHIRSVIEQPKRTVIVMTTAGNFAYNITTRESYENILDMLGVTYVPKES
jgi:hypothetical protein